MENLFLRVFTVSAAVSLLLLPLLLCRGWIEKKYAPRTRWGLWLVIAVALLTVPWVPKPQAPVVVEAPAYMLTLPVVPARSPRAPAAPKGQPATPVGAQTQPIPPAGNQTGPITSIQAGDQTQAPVQTNPQPAPPAETQSAASQRPTISLTALAAGLWLAGLIFVLLRQGGWYLLARRRLLRSSKPVTGLEHYAAELGLEDRVTFYHCRAVPGPMTLGVWKPAVLLPPDGLAVAALRHELYHVKRRDVAYKVLLLCACALHWFNPLVWLMYRAADRDVEACCDAAVVEGRDNGYKRSYGELLLTTAAESRAFPFTTSFGGEAEQMKARLTQLFRPGKQSKALVCAVLALAVALGSLVACQQTAPKALADGIYCSPLDNITWPIGKEDAEGEDYGSIGLSLLEYSDTEGPHGKPLGEYTLPLSDDLMLHQLWWGEDQSAGEKGTEEWQRAVFELVNWPIYRNSMPLGTDYLVVTVKDGKITRLSWAMVSGNDTLYVNETYGFTLQLPESWGGRYVVEEVNDQYGVSWYFFERTSYEAKPGEKWGCLFIIDLDDTSDYVGETLTPNAADGWGILGIRDREVYRMVSPTDVTWLPETRESYAELEKDVSSITPEKFGFIGEVYALQPLRSNTMPTLDYYDPEREFLLYHTLDTAYFYYRDTVEEYHAGQAGGKRVLWRCDVSEDEQTVYLSDVFDDGEGRDERFYAWDIEKRELKAVDSIPAGVDHMIHVAPEELFYSGFMNGTSLKSNVLKAKDGTLVGLYIDELIGNTIEYLQLSRMESNGAWVGGEPFLTPERIPSPRVYTDPDWGFALTLPESLAGRYVVSRAANNWNFYDKELYNAGGYLFSIWAEDSVEQQRIIDNYPGKWDGKILGEKDGITYTATFWDESMTTPVEQENEGYMARMEEVKVIGGDDLDLTSVTRSSGDLWPLPYIEYGSDVILEGNDYYQMIRILSPEGVTVQSMAAGTVETVKAHPTTEEQSVVIRHPDGRYSEYRHLEYVQVAEGDEVKRGEILGFAKEGKGKRWILFSIYEGDSWETSKPIDPLEGREYRTYDFRPITSNDLTIAGDPMITETFQSVLRGEIPFYNVESQEYQYANALPDSDSVAVTVCRYTEVDVDGDRIPEVVLWLDRGGNESALGSIVLHYRGGQVYGYPMGYRSLNLETLKADGTFQWSGSALDFGFAKMDFYSGGGENITWCEARGSEGEKYYVNGVKSSAEDFEAEYQVQTAKPDVEWHSLSEANP